jgi:hypothetical protein
MIQIVRALVAYSLSALLFASICAQSLRAQVATATIVGTITDSTGGVVPGAKVSVTNVNTGLIYRSVTNNDGDYIVTELSAGPYNVQTAKAGFKTASTRDVVLAIGDRYRADVKLEVGQASEAITVEAGAAKLQTDSPTVSQVIGEQQVQDLPLNGRDFVMLTQLVPGATDNTTGSFSTGDAVDDRRRSSTVSVNGFNGAQNNFMIDGMDDNERFIGTVSVKPSIEAIGEIQVITNTFSAEMSRTNGAGISFITKSGTNQYHGTAFEFLRNQVLDARLPMQLYNTPKAPYRQNNFGGSAGGPIRKNKTFFFYDWETYKNNRGQVNTATVPTPSEIAGNFKGINPIFDPLSNVAAGSGVTRTEFPNDQIPVSRMDPAAMHVLNDYPAANTTGILGANPAYPGTFLPVSNFVDAPSRIQTDNTMDIRVDHRFSDNSSGYVRYSYNHTTTTTPHTIPTAADGIDLVGGAGGYTNQSNHSLQINEVYTINPRTILVVQGAYLRWYLASLQTGYGRSEATQLGIPGVNIDGDSTGVPTINITASQGFIGTGEGGYQPNLDTNNTFQETVSLQFLRGAHSMKAGGSFMKRQVDETQSSDARGTFSFTSALTSNTTNTTTTGNGLASLELGYWASDSRSKYLIHPGYRYTEPALYFQDDWRARKWLTVNLGLRWEYFSPLSEEHNRIANFNFNTYSLDYAGVNGISNTVGVKRQFHDFGPRLGFAAQINKKTVVHGGFGINYAPDLQGTPGSFRNGIYNSSLSNTATTTQFLGTLSQGLPLPVPGSNSNLVGAIAAVSYNYETPRTYQYNVTFQRQLPFDLLLSSGIVGNLGRKLSGSNSSFPEDGAAPGTANVAVRRVYAGVLPNVTSIANVTNYFNSNFTSLQTTLSHPFKHGMTLTVNHTWAHQFDNSEVRYVLAATGAQLPTLIYGPSGSDVRQHITIAMTYNLPFGNHSNTLLAKVVHQWRLSTIGTMQTGALLAISQTGGQTNGATGTNRPNVVGDPLAGAQTYTKWFNTAAFVPQPNYVWGDLSRFGLYGPGRWNFDVGVHREFKPLERTTLQFRVETFNTTNTQTPGNPNTQLGSATFGQITTISGNRTVQVALKLLF